MATINVTYHANTRLMEITQSTSNGVATTGDNNTTRIQFTFDDTGGLLNGYQKRAEFNVLVPADNSTTYKPYIYLDENDGVSLPNTILANVKCGTLPMQLAFTKTVDGEKIELYSLNILNLRINNAINALYPTPSQSYPTVRDAIYDVQYDNSDASFTFTQLDGNTIVVTLSDLREEHFEVETYEDLASLTDAENGDTATVLSTGIWYKLYVDGEDSQWYPVAGITELNGALTLVPSFFAPTTSGTSGQYLESGGNGQPPVWVSKVTNVVQSDAVPTSRAVYIGLEAKLDDSQLITSWGDADSKATDGNIPSARLVKTLLNQHTDSINSISSKIPAQASSSNQLADKNYVNNAIATESADYLGKYNAVTDLHIPQEVVDTYTFDPTEEMATQVATAISTQLSLDPTNNDTVNIIINKSTTTNFDWYWSFKFNDTQNEWKFQFPIGNTAFTPSEWETIDSGLTSEDVTAIRNIGDGTVNIIDSGAGSLGSFTLNQKQDVTITVPDGSTQYINQSATFVLQDVPDYADYPYRASVPITNMTHTMFANVVFSDEQVDSGVYSPMCETYDGGVYVYANADVGTITIPTISAGYDTSLELDSVPTQNSTDAVMSGGVWSAIGSDSRVVHTTGDEIIAGNKRFSENLTVVRDTPQFIAKTTKHELGTAPSSNSNLYFAQRDKNDADFVRYQGRYSTSRDSRGSITVYNKHSNNTTDTAEFHVLNSYDGTKYITGPSRTYNASNTSDVVTIGSLQASTDVVHTTGNETIGGTKTFTSNPYFEGSPYIKNTSPEIRFNNTNSLVSSDGMAMSLRGYDASHSYAQIDGYRRGASSLSELHMYVRNTSDTTARMAIYEYDNGTAWAVCPSRTYNASNTSDIVTIGSLQASTDVVHTSGAETIAGQKTFTSNPVSSTISGGYTIKGTDQTQTTAPSSNRFLGYEMVGSDGTLLAQYGVASRTNGNREAYIDVVNTDTSVNSIRIYSLANNTGYATLAHTRSYANAGNPDILTKGHLEEAITIGGNKTFTDIVKILHSATTGGYIPRESNFVLQDTRYAVGTAVNSEYINRIYFTDSANDRVATIGVVKSPTNNNVNVTQTGITNFYNSSQYTIFSVRTAYNSGSGTYEKYATVNARSYNASNTDDIVNIGSLQASTDVVHTSGNETIEGLKTFREKLTIIKNGIIAGYTHNNTNMKQASPYLTGTQISYLQFTGDSGKSIANFEVFQNQDGGRGIRLTLYDKNNAYKYEPLFQIDESGNTVASLVHTAGNETITGNKTINGQLYKNIRNNEGKDNYLNSDLTNRNTRGNSTIDVWPIAIGKSSGNPHSNILFEDTTTSRKLALRLFCVSHNNWQSVDIMDDSSGAYLTTPYRPYSSAGNTDVLVKGHVADMMSANVGDGQISFTSSRGTAIDNFTVNQSSGKNIVLPAGSTQYQDEEVTFALQSTPDFSDYPYMASKSITGLTADMYATVTYSDTQVSSGQYAPFCQTVAGEVRLYAKSSVGTQTIPTISVGMDDSSAQQSMTNFVTLTGDQTITGVKTFTGKPLKITVLGGGTTADTSLKISDNRTDAGHTIGTNTSDFTLGKIGFFDGSGNWGGTILAESPSDDHSGQITFAIRAINGTSSSVLRVRGGSTAGTGYATIYTRTYSSSNTNDVVTIGSLQASTDVVHTVGEETINGGKTYTAPIYGNAFGAPISRTLGYHKVLNLGDVPSTSQSWYLNIIFAYRYSTSLCYVEAYYDATQGTFGIASVSGVKTTGIFINNEYTGNTTIAIDVINGKAYLVIHRVNQNNAFSRLTLLDIQKSTNSHPVVDFTRMDEVYTPATTLSEKYIS